MRILRGQSNLEVSSQGFAWFVVGLILATFLGGAIRVILSSERVHKRIVAELKSRFPRHEFRIGQTDVLLSRGLWPALGLRVHDITFRQDVCGKLSFDLKIPQAVLPVDLLSLRHGRARLGRVEFNDASMHLDYRDCPLNAPVVSGAPALSERQPLAREAAIRPPRVAWSELAQALEGLRLKNLAVTYERNPNWKLIFHQLEVRLHETMAMEGIVDVRKSLPFGELSHTVELEATGDAQTLSWTMMSDYKEGRATFAGKWDLAANTAETKLQLTQLPLKELSSELYQMGFVENEVGLKTAWLTCGAQWNGSFERFVQSPLQLSHCKLEGAYGRVELSRADYFAKENPPFREAAVFRVQQLQVQPLLEAMGRQVLPAVVARLGVWSGTVNYRGPSLWQIDGVLENGEVVFSNQSVRGKQLVQRVHTLAQQNGGRIDLSVDELVLQDGDFRGQLGFRLSGDWRSGEFTADVGRLSLSPSIQSLLIGGSFSPVQINGNGRLENGELAFFKGQLQVGELQGEGWRGQELNVQARYQPGVFRLEARAAKAVADARWRLFTQVSLPARDVASEAVAWKDLALRLEVNKTGGQFQSFTANEIGRQRQWRAHGSWIRDGELTGSLSVNGAGRTQTFGLRGEKGQLTIADKSPNETL